MSEQQPPQTKTGTPRLSEAARHVVLPSGIVTTGWAPVRDKSAELGIRYHRWQDGCGRAILAKRADGLYAAGIGGVVLSIPRQVGKTFLIGGIVFALCLLFPGLTVIWTAHALKTAGETFRSMQGMARRKAIKPHVLKVVLGSGDEAIEFHNGSRILFGARERGFGLGFTMVDVLVLDEAQRVTEKAMDDLVPTTNQAPNPLIFLIGTPPRPTDGGEVFSARRREALSGESDDMVYVEFSADAGTDPGRWPKGHIDWDQVAKANPSFPRHTPRAAILRMFKNLGLASFRREGLGIWDADGRKPSLIHPDTWADLATENPPTTGERVFGVKFSPDGSTVALGVALAPTGGPIHVEGIESRPTAGGVGWLTAWLVERHAKARRIVIDGKAGSAGLFAALRAAGVPERTIVLPTTDQVVTAHSMLLEAVESGEVSHFDQPELNESVGCAEKRKIGTAGGWGWSPINGGDVTLIEAVTFAHWGAKTNKRSTAPRAPMRIY